jgi:hypothetical protein
LQKQRPTINHNLRCRRLAAGITESQVAEQVARLVLAQTGRDLPIDGNYVSKLERGVITWPNRAYRQAFRTLFDAVSDAELGFYPRRTRRDAERWVMSSTGVGGDDALDLLGTGTLAAIASRIGRRTTSMSPGRAA